MDMRFYLVRNRQRQGQFRMYWKPGKDNYADYYTKHHPTPHHREWRKKLLTPPGDEVSNFVTCTRDLRGCIEYYPDDDVINTSQYQRSTVEVEPILNRLKNEVHASMTHN